MAKSDNINQEEPLEKPLCKSADRLRKNINVAEYKHIVLGLKFMTSKIVKSGGHVDG